MRYRVLKMAVFLKKKIQDNEVYLQRYLNVKGILCYLYGPNIITQEEQDEIYSQTTRHDQVYKFLRTLERKPFSSYQIFLDALVDSGQEFIKHELEKENAGTEDTETSHITRNLCRPEQLEVLNTTENSISLKWIFEEEIKDSVDYFEIKTRVCWKKKSQWKTTETQGPETEHTIYHLEPNTEYEIKIRAIIDGEEMNPSDVVGPVRTKFPNLNEPLAYEISESKISFHWFPIDDCKSVIQCYKLKKRETGAIDWTTVSLNIADNIFSDVELIENTEYEYQVCAITVDGWQICSKVAKIKTSMPAPSKPFALAVKSNSIFLEAHIPTKYESLLIHYKVQYKINGHSEWEHVSSEIPGEYVKIERLQGETTYVFRIRAIYKNGYSAYSNISEPVATKRDRPTKPTSDKTSSHEIAVEWKPPEDLEHAVSQYEVWFRDLNYSTWNTQVTTDARLCHKVENLTSNTPYEFKIRAINGDYLGSFSSTSDPITTEESIANMLKESSERISELGDSHKQRYDIYQLPVKEINKRKDSKTRQCELDLSSCQTETNLCEQHYPQRNKTILLMGATGSGKTALVDSMVNYILDVSLDDPFRFSIVNLQKEEKEKKYDQSLSQTEWITMYRIPNISGSKVPYSVDIIDTPGFGDTRGIRRDEEITQQIHRFFKEADYLSGVDMIGFVIPASEVRLTPVQKYVYDRILSIFGVDCDPTIFVFITFADLGIPPVISALKKENIPLNDAYMFNNGSLFVKSEDAPQKWNLGNRNLQKLFYRLRSTTKVNLSLTKEVLERQLELETTVQGLEPRISEGLDHLETLRQQITVLKQHKSDIQANKNFEFEVDVLEKKQTKQNGLYSTNCKNCKITCHFPCKHTPNTMNYFCYAMKNNTCTVCEGKCGSGDHEMSEYKYETCLVKRIKTFDELKLKYNRAEAEAKTKKELIACIKQDIQKVWIEIGEMIERICLLIQSLEKIALRPSPLGNTEYIKILIQTEKSEGRRGVEGRIAFLNTLLDYAELMKSCTDGEFATVNKVDVDSLLHTFDKFREHGRKTKLRKIFKNVKKTKQELMYSLTSI